MYASSRLYPDYHHHPQRQPLFQGQVGAGLNQQVGTGLYDKAVNWWFGKEYLRDGERHPIMKLKDGTYRPGEYLGPGSHVMDKMRAGVKPVSDVDAISARHDLAYSLAQSEDDVRAADNHMLERLKAVKARGSDTNWNINMGRVGISSKKILEDKLGVPKKWFTDFGGMDDPKEREFAQAKMDELTQQGFGQHGKGRSKTSGQYVTWKQHLAQYRADHPGISMKTAMKQASKTYRKNK